MPKVDVTTPMGIESDASSKLYAAATKLVELESKEGIDVRFLISREGMGAKGFDTRNKKIIAIIQNDNADGLELFAEEIHDDLNEIGTVQNEVQQLNETLAEIEETSDRMHSRKLELDDEVSSLVQRGNRDSDTIARLESENKGLREDVQDLTEVANKGLKSKLPEGMQEITDDTADDLKSFLRNIHKMFGGTASGEKSPGVKDAPFMTNQLFYDNVEHLFNRLYDDRINSSSFDFDSSLPT